MKSHPVISWKRYRNQGRDQTHKKYTEQYMGDARRWLQPECLNLRTVKSTSCVQGNFCRFPRLRGCESITLNRLHLHIVVHITVYSCRNEIGNKYRLSFQAYCTSVF